jgi:hypothetical protein
MDRADLDCGNNRYRGGRLPAAGRKMGALAGSGLACLSRCGERIKLSIVCSATLGAASGRRLFFARSADSGIFSENANAIGNRGVKAKVHLRFPLACYLIPAWISATS